MPLSNTARPVPDAPSLVTIGSYDLRVTPEHAAAYAAGELTLMSTKAGPSTTLVDSRHNFVGQGGLAKRADVGADILAVGGRGAAGASAAAGWPVAVAVVVTLGTTTATWYILHRRKKAMAPATDNKKALPAADDDQFGVETVSSEAEAELARPRQTNPNSERTDGHF